MRRMQVVHNLAILFTMVFALLLTTLALGQVPSSDQCSMAVVSKLASQDGKVCGNHVVQEMAKQGHVFEQNQLGIASILAIGPDYNESEALKWFEQAAHRGYAPAQVNLAAMYANGWGTATNYAAALRWFRAAADQGFARAYYNLGTSFSKDAGSDKTMPKRFAGSRKGR